jgi:DNA-directed RNA polymerase specialized sigma24 family protein
VLRQIQTVEKSRDNEKIFLDNYDWLLARAQTLTRGSKGQAKELLQDLYVRFAQAKSGPEVSDENRLRGYLYRTLKNLSISQGLRNGRNALSNLMLVDYDSAEIAVAAVDRSQLLYVRSDLAGICEYACIRRRTARAASVLILRFFFGYHSSEIVGILQSTPVAVDRLIQIARQEARAFLTRPGALHFMGQDVTRTPPYSQYLPDESAALFAELRRRIFTEVEGDCAPEGEIESRYGTPPGPQVTTPGLAHLVSCRSCLEKVNSLLHLPSLSERFSSDFLDHTDDSSPPSPGSSRHTLPKLRKKLRETFEHRPIKLQIAVNGEIRGAQQVTSSISNFQIKLKPFSRPEFIEVLSEQGLCLLYLDLETTDITDPSSQRAEVELSDGRSLIAEITSGGASQVVNVSYYDPLLDDASETRSLNPELWPLPLHEDPTNPSPARKRFSAWIRERLSRWLSTFNWRWPLSLGLATASVAVLIGLGLFNDSRKKTTTLPSASALLTESIRAEQNVIPPQGAVRQTFALEVWSGEGSLLDSVKVESLQSRLPERSAFRLFTANGGLIAGRWTDSAGNVTRYSKKQGLQHPSSDRQPQSQFDEAWTHIPDAAGFEKISGDPQKLSVQRNGESYELDYADAGAANNSAIISANLVLAAATLHPVAETLRLRDGRETREYRFRELKYEVVPVNQVQNSDFDPKPELSRLRSGLPSIRPDANDAHLALEALQLLSNLGPEVERIVDMERLPDGSVRLSGVFSTSEQKAAVLRVFESMPSGGHLKLALHSNDEGSGSIGPKSRLIHVESVASIEVENQRIPFDSELRSFLSSQGLSDQLLEERIHQVATDTIGHSAQLHREAWSIRQISANDFTSAELRLMQPDDKMLWLTLLDKHLRAFDQGLSAIDRDLAFLHPDEQTPLRANSPAPSSPRNTNELGSVANRLNQNSERLDRLLTADLTLSSSNLPTNHNVAEIAELLADLRIQESMLHITVGRLQTLRIAPRTK